MATYQIETDNGTYEVETEDSSAIDNPATKFDVLKESAKQVRNTVVPAPMRAAQDLLVGAIPSKNTLINSSFLPVAGGIVGGGIGGVPGAALGGATGESFRQIGARYLGGDAPQTSLQAAKDIGIEGATQGVGEILGTKVVSPILGKAASLIKKPAGQLFELVTKIDPKNAKTLFENPKAILPSEWEKAKLAWRSAAEKAGIPVDDVSPQIIDALKKDARQTVYGVFQKIQSNESVSAAEAQTAKQALDIALVPAAKTERNKPLIALYGKMRQKFTEKIGEESPDLAKANKDYAIAKAGSKFRTFFPKNLNDKPDFLRSSSLPFSLLGLGALRGDPLEGAIQGGLAATAVSPLTIGSGIALAGSARPLLPIARRAATSISADLLQKKLRGK